MCHPRNTQRLRQHFAHPHAIRELAKPRNFQPALTAQQPQPHMTHLATIPHLDLQRQTALSLHHTGALLTATWTITAQPIIAGQKGVPVSHHPPPPPTP